MANRASKDDAFMLLAFALTVRTTCPRRKVGCVLVDEHSVILSTGYNGSGPGEPHCIDSPCPGAAMPSGTGLDACRAIHAEQNAVVRCREPHRIHTAYVTTLPCVSCIKLFKATSCKRIVYAQSYPHAEATIDAWPHTIEPIGDMPKWNTVTSFLQLVWRPSSSSSDSSLIESLCSSLRNLRPEVPPTLDELIPFP